MKSKSSEVKEETKRESLVSVLPEAMLHLRIQSRGETHEEEIMIGTAACSVVSRRCTGGA